MAEIQLQLHTPINMFYTLYGNTLLDYKNRFEIIKVSLKIRWLDVEINFGNDQF